MAMMSCQECNHQISDRAANCPNCGAPVAAGAPAAPAVVHPKPRVGALAAAVVVLGCVSVAIWLILPRPFRTELAGMSLFTHSAAAYRGDSSGSYAATYSPDAPPPMYSTTAEQLYQDYNANGVATQTRIGNRRIRVSGNVTDIDEDATGHAVVKLWTGNAPATGAEFRLNDDQRAAAAELVKGQAIDIECARMQHVMAAPEGSGCALVPAETGSQQAYLAVAISEERGQAPIYIVGPMARTTCLSRSDTVSAQVAGNIPGAHIVSKLCSATAQENLPTSGCRLDTSMSAMPDMPAAHLWKYECSLQDASRPAKVSTKESTRGSRKVAAPVVPTPISGPYSAGAGELASAAPPIVTTVSSAGITAGAPATSSPMTNVGAVAEVPSGDSAPQAAASPIDYAPTAAATSTATASLAAAPPYAAPSDVSEAPATPADLLSVKAKDPGAAEHIASYCNNATASAANHDAVAAGCRHDEVAAWNRLVVQNEFPSLDEASRQKCSQAPFPDSYVAKEVCAKYQLRVN